MNIFMWIIFRELIKWIQCQYQQMHNFTVYIEKTLLTTVVYHIASSMCAIN